MLSPDRNTIDTAVYKQPLKLEVPAAGRENSHQNCAFHAETPISHRRTAALLSTQTLIRLYLNAKRTLCVVGVMATSTLTQALLKAIILRIVLTKVPVVAADLADSPPTIGEVFAQGIQDISAVAALLGTELCAEKTMAGVQDGYLNSSIAGISMFGALGGIKAVMLSSLPARWLDNFGYRAVTPWRKVTDWKDGNALSFDFMQRFDMTGAVLTTVEAKPFINWWLKAVYASCLTVLGFVPFVWPMAATSQRYLACFPVMRVTGSLVISATIPLMDASRLWRWNHWQRAILVSVLMLASLAVAAGYIGCYTLIQQFQGNIVYVWLVLEMVMMIIRMAVWAWNPDFDDGPNVLCSFSMDNRYFKEFRPPTVLVDSDVTYVTAIGGRELLWSRRHQTDHGAKAENIYIGKLQQKNRLLRLLVCHLDTQEAQRCGTKYLAFSVDDDDKCQEYWEAEICSLWFFKLCKSSTVVMPTQIRNVFDEAIEVWKQIFNIRGILPHHGLITYTVHLSPQGELNSKMDYDMSRSKRTWDDGDSLGVNCGCRLCIGGLSVACLGHGVYASTTILDEICSNKTYLEDRALLLVPYLGDFAESELKRVHTKNISYPWWAAAVEYVSLMLIDRDQIVDPTMSDIMERDHAVTGHVLKKPLALPWREKCWYAWCAYVSSLTSTLSHTRIQRLYKVWLVTLPIAYTDVFPQQCTFDVSPKRSVLAVTTRLQAFVAEN